MRSSNRHNRPPRRLIGLGVLLTFSLVLGPVVAEAKPAAKLVHLGRLSLTDADAQPGHVSTDAIVDGLRELGYAEGQDFVVERRNARGDADRLPDLAQELVGLPVDVLLVDGVVDVAPCKVAGVLRRPRQVDEAPRRVSGVVELIEVLKPTIDVKVDSAIVNRISD